MINLLVISPDYLKSTRTWQMLVTKQCLAQITGIALYLVLHHTLKFLKQFKWKKEMW